MDISIVRGDTLSLAITNIKMSDGSDYILKDSDIIYLDVKKTPASKNAIFTKTVTASDYIDKSLTIMILPEDTVDLVPGDYVYDVRLYIDDNNIYTIVPASKFKILYNITDIPESAGDI